MMLNNISIALFWSLYIFGNLSCKKNDNEIVNDFKMMCIDDGKTMEINEIKGNERKMYYIKFTLIQQQKCIYL